MKWTNPEKTQTAKKKQTNPKLKIELPYYPAITLLGIYPKKMKPLRKIDAPQCSQQQKLTIAKI